MRVVQLRDYQLQCVVQILESFGTHDRVLLQASTGSGKTEIAAHLSQGIINNNGKVFFVVHRRELLRQVADRVKAHDMEPGYIAAGYKLPRDEAFIICSIQSLVKRIGVDELPEPKLIICDEAHHATSASYKKLFDYAEKIGAKTLGLTATPRRLDKKPLYPLFQSMVQGPPIKQLINDGWLAQPEVYLPPNSINAVDKMRESWHLDKGEYKTAEVEHDLLDNKLIYGDAIEHYKSLCPGEPALVFCTSVQHCKQTAAEFNSAGIVSRSIDGSMSDADRVEILDGLRNRTIQCVMSCELIGEGFDCPDVSCAVLLRPTASLVTFLQQCGRALRPSPGKRAAVILDHVNNVATHGPPWLERYWTLDEYGQKEKKDPLTGVNLKLCGLCGQYLPSSVKVCPECAYVFVSKEREVKPVRQIATKLVKLTPAMVLEKEKRKMAGNKKTLEDLVEYARSNGWKNPEKWAEKAFKQSQADDDIFYKGNEAQLVELYTRRKHPDPVKKAGEVLVKRAELQKEGGAKVQDEVFRSGSFDQLVAWAQKNGKGNGVNYARAVLRNRFKTVLEEGSLEEVTEAAKLMGYTTNPGKAAATIIAGRMGTSPLSPVSDSPEGKPAVSPTPTSVTSAPAKKSLKELLAPHTALLDTGSREEILFVLETIPEISNVEALADAAIARRSNAVAL